MIESASITDRQLATSCCWNNKQNVRRLGTNRSCRWQMLQNWAKKNKETAVIFFLETGAIFYGIHPDVAYVWAQICELIKDKNPIRFDKIRSQSTSGTFLTWHRFFIPLFFTATDVSCFAFLHLLFKFLEIVDPSTPSLSVVVFKSWRRETADLFQLSSSIRVPAACRCPLFPS